MTSAQPGPSAPRTAIEDWVLGRARTVPERTPEQFGQLQFHCGNPPPAAAPSTLIFMGLASRSQCENQMDAARLRGPTPRGLRAMIDQRLLMYIVISMPKRMSIASGVSHFIEFSFRADGRRQIARRTDHPRLEERETADDHERHLMIFMSLRAVHCAP